MFVQHLNPEVAIKHLKEQIHHFENMIYSTNLLSNRAWYQDHIDSMKERIKNYSI